MSDFSFVGTVECDACGATLSDSDEECDHDGEQVDVHVFREVGGGRDSMVGVEATHSYKWHALAEKRTNWIAYEWIGTREWIEDSLSKGYWDSIEELPTREISAKALHTPDSYETV